MTARAEPPGRVVRQPLRRPVRRRWDWSEFHGIAIGLDRDDYEGQFLGQWTNHNVWTQASPAQDAGEVKPTWQIVSKREVLQNAIYNEHLRERDLNEGMRLVL